MFLPKIQKSISSFAKIGLSEMDSVKLMDRVETKFALSLDRLPFILDQLQNDYKVVSISNNEIPEYLTAYFDTDNYHFYKEHHRKRKDRFKVRYRNYVDSSLTFLEVKHKKNGRVDKKRMQVENAAFSLNEDQKSFLEKADISATGLELRLSNSYHRVTLVAKQSIERVTFDMNIKFKQEEMESDLDKLVIVEVKQAELSRVSPIYQALRNAQVKPYNLSKYCVGLVNTLGEEKIKYNNFKKKLLKIEKINVA